MKKKLALITFEENAAQRYEAQLREFFAEAVAIQSIAVAHSAPDQVIEADLFLLSFADITNYIGPYIPPQAQVVYMTRTFDREKAQQLAPLPKGTKALLVDYSEILATETLGVLNELGYQDIRFTLWYPEAPPAVEAQECSIVITPGNQRLFGETPLPVIDLGWYKISVTTYMELIQRLELGAQWNQQIYDYSKQVCLTNAGLFDQIRHTWGINHRWDAVIEMIDDGIIVTDQEGQLVHCNKQAAPAGDHLLPQLNQQQTMDHQLVELPQTGQTFLVTKQEICTYGDLQGYLILLKDVTEIQRLEHDLRKIQAQKGFQAKYTFDHIITDNPLMADCISRSQKIARTDAAVLIEGESGTGKELFAQSIHSASARKDMAFVAVNCAALPTELLESELFGYEEGSFTGARKGGKKGLFELAHKGTLFLDELGEMPLPVQAKLLRVLQEKEVMKVGGDSVIPVDVRILAASNVNFKELMEAGQFRKDLYYRINTMKIIVPPLRKRPEDIALLAAHFLQHDYASRQQLDEELSLFLQALPWPGNIRELQNCMAYMAAMGAPVLTKKDLPPEYLEDVSGDSQRTPGVPAGLAPSPLPLTTPAGALPGQPSAPTVTPHFSGFLADEQMAVEAILRLLSFRSLGRRKLLELLAGEGIFLSDYKIRQIMKLMEQKELIQKAPGNRRYEMIDQSK